eukprot:2182220-Rhodomonas_salina.1
MWGRGVKWSGLIASEYAAFHPTKTPRKAGKERERRTCGIEIGYAAMKRFGTEIARCCRAR